LWHETGVRFIGEIAGTNAQPLPWASEDSGAAQVLLDWNFDVPAHQAQQNITRGDGWTWINITVSVTITYRVTIDKATVIEGDCRGFTVNHYHWLDEETDFDIEIEVEAHNERANGTVEIAAPFPP